MDTQTTNGALYTFNGQPRYQIIETDSGLQISESRVMLFDVMEAHDEGDSIYQISQTFNLTPLQVQTAVHYIEQHRAVLEPEFAKAIQLRQEREEYYRKLAEERWEKIAQLPMTPQRAAFYALREKNQREALEKTDADHSE
jgi:uncharacterized protein (DUF433 family)